MSAYQISARVMANNHLSGHRCGAPPKRTAITTTVIALLVIIIVLIGAMGGILLVPQLVTRTTSTFTQTVTVMSGANQTSVTATSCTMLAPTFGVIVRVLTNATSPLVGARVSGQSVGYCNGSQQTSQLQPTTTNSSGWASLLDGGFGIYYLDISHSYIDQGQNYTDHYSLSITTAPIAVTCVVFYYPSGNVTTHVFYSSSRCVSN